MENALSTWTVAHVKAVLEPHCGIPAHLQVLASGRALVNPQTLSFRPEDKEFTLHLRRSQTPEHSQMFVKVRAVCV